MEIKNLINVLPWHNKRRWNKRAENRIDKIIIHQELGEGTIEQVNKYHVGPNHISQRGCPHFAYHFGIRKNGEIVQANEFTDVTWHTKGQNSVAIGIMLVGNFNGPGYDLGTSTPTAQQMQSLEQLVKYLQAKYHLTNQEVYGHYHFGKRACPGDDVGQWIENYRNDLSQHPEIKTIPRTFEEIQKRLNHLGYDCGAVDGIPGPRTSAAIRAFQSEYDLLVDGVVGPQTWKMLLELTVPAVV